MRPDQPDGERERDRRGIDEAEAALLEALHQWPEVRQVTEQIRGFRQRNHLAEMTERALTGRRR